MKVITFLSETAKTMKLAIMTRPTFFVEENKFIVALCDGGLGDLHIFKPGSSPVYVERLLSLLPEDMRRHITVHDNFYLKEEFNLGAIHLKDAKMERPAGYKGKFSRSCSSLDDLKEAKRKSRYVFLHNVFDSLSDESLNATFTSAELASASRRGLIDKHVYALGGVTIDKAPMLRDLGFGGIVICGDLWNRFDIHNETDYKHIIQYFEKLKLAIG